MAKNSVLEFKVLSAELDTVKKGANKGEPIVRLRIIEDDVFAEKSSEQGVVLFITESQVPGWEVLVNDIDRIPNMLGTYEIIQTKPYRTKDNKGIVRDKIKTAMRVFVRCDNAGNPKEDANSKVHDIINRLCEWVETDEE